MLVAVVGVYYLRIKFIEIQRKRDAGVWFNFFEYSAAESLKELGERDSNWKTKLKWKSDKT